MNRWTRRLHRWGAFLSAVPLLLVIVTGLLLQVKKEVPWVQPPTMRGSKGEPTLSFAELLEVARQEPRAEIATWEDVARIDVRIDRGLIKVIANNHWEQQIDAQTGERLSSTMRRSDWIESLHDGSYFHELAKLWIFLPNGLVLLGLWISGVYLWWIHIQAKGKKRNRRTVKAQPDTPEEAGNRPTRANE